MTTVENLVDQVKSHRLYDHPMYDHWAQAVPPPDVTGAVFHQIQKFCASTRPGLAFPEGLRSLGWLEQSRLIEEIVVSESGHGSDLATMAGYIVNRSAPGTVFADVEHQGTVEAGIKEFSDHLLGTLPGYVRPTGLTAQASAAIGVFLRRGDPDPETTVKNLGTALALEIISNRSLIPGEKHALVDSGNYGVTLEDPEMHYLADHWGEAGAEQQHEQNVLEAVGSVLDPSTSPLIEQGVADFLETLSALWDVIDAALLRSGQHRGA